MKYLFRTLFLATVLSATAYQPSQPTLDVDTANVLYRVNRSRLDTTYCDNGAVLGGIVESLDAMSVSADTSLVRIEVVGVASPEGPVGNNKRLAVNRARQVQEYISSHTATSDSLIDIVTEKNAWVLLRDIARNDTILNGIDEVMQYLDALAENDIDTKEHTQAFRKLWGFKSGIYYRYIYKRLYPLVRAASVRVVYLAESRPAEESDTTEVVAEPDTLEVVVEPDTIVVPTEPDPMPVVAPIVTPKPLYMSLKTNMLYDAALLPNIGAELYVGSNLSVTANWMYGWWNCDSRHHYWRAYGGDVGVRYWLSHVKPLTGHHIGVYGQMLTYDFEWGGKGYMGGVPGGSLWDKAHWGVGIEYGFALPIARRLNIDFTIGLGYLGGEYREYIPIDDCYVWQATKYRHWWGPTKVEISLVWLLGSGNHNKPKGGEQ